MYAKKIKQKKLSWGAIALVAPFPSHDVVSLAGSVLGGERYFDKEEIADIHAELLMEGTAKRSKKEIQEFLDSIGASLGFSSGGERLHFSAKVRPQHLGALIELIAECLSMPTFPEPELAVLKMREAANLELEAENTNAQASIALARFLFKHDHPNYADTTNESKAALKSITGKRLREEHAKMIDGRSLIISLAGDITAAKGFALVEKHFKTLPKHKVIFKSFAKAAVSPAKSASVTIVNKASIDYVLGLATGALNTAPDYPALVLGIQILGNRGGFTGRLMKTVREEEGLTYGIYALLSGFKSNVDGYLYVWATFAPQLFEKGKASIKRQLDLLLTHGVSEDEVKKHAMLYDAKSKVQLSNSGAYARAAHDVIVDGKKLSYLDEFPKKILKLKAKDVQAALKKYLLVKNMSEAAAGTFENS